MAPISTSVSVRTRSFHQNHLEVGRNMKNTGLLNHFAARWARIGIW